MQQTNCTPWDYPLPNGVDHAPLCTSYYDGENYFNSLNNFEMSMEDSDVLNHCTHECLPNCESVTYSYVMDTTYLEANELCHDEAEMREVMDIDWQKYVLYCLLYINFQMALALWNSTDNVQAWFHRLAMSKVEFTFEAGTLFQVEQCINI